MEDIGNSGRYATGADTCPSDTTASAVSWAAIVAGGVGAAAFSLILLTLGSGLGLASISPWAPARESAARFGIAAVIWVCVTQIFASGLGGYLAGRLRTRWIGIPRDETYFRDTAHGFLSWALATLVTAALLTTAISGLFHEGVQETAAGNSVGARPVGRDSTAGENAWPMGYFVDSLFRLPAAPAAAVSTSPGDKIPTAEVVRIFQNSLATGDQLSADDSQYVGQLVTQHTGVSREAAQARVNTTYSRLQQKLSDLKASAKDAADKARKAAIYASLWLFVSLLMGAFSASLLATYGGRQRDL